jgi:phosphopantothenoylcysteine decarboxylase/phosphopantothenate--cysteine ligase
MRFLVTCGPTFEPLDKVRRLTNFSTGKLGVGLANYLQDAGHEVTVLKGYYATCKEACLGRTIVFTTTADLRERFQEAAKEKYEVIFHTAAVSDFGFGKVFRRSENGALEPVTSGKFSTRDGNLLAELLPTPKIIAQLRELFPTAKIFGWKYEVDGTRENAILLGKKQVEENRTDYCVVNGPAYGRGFGILDRDGGVEHRLHAEALYSILLRSTTKE